MNLTIDELLELVPQQKPFRFIDKIHFIDDISSVCSYTFKEDEYFYKGHFPGNHITPGVILIEACAQMSIVLHGIWLGAKECSNKEDVNQHTTFFSNVESAEFLKPVLPNETVTVEGKLLVWKRKRIKHDVTMKNSNGEIVMTCILGGFAVKTGDKK